MRLCYCLVTQPSNHHSAFASNDNCIGAGAESWSCSSTVEGRRHVDDYGYSKTADGWGPELGKYSEDGKYTYTFKVDKTFGTEIAISEVDVVTWTSTSTGWFGNAPGGETDKNNYRYIINSTSLKVISETWSKNDTGHFTWVLIDPSTLVKGATLIRTWWAPYNGNTTSIATDQPATVLGSITESLNGTDLTLWNVAVTGPATGIWYYYTGQPNIYRYSIGQETDALLYESTYGIWAGYSVVGTYTGYVHCDGCGGGGWTDTFANTGILTSSNINFGT